MNKWHHKMNIWHYDFHIFSNWRKILLIHLLNYVLQCTKQTTIKNMIVYSDCPSKGSPVKEHCQWWQRGFRQSLWKSLSKPSISSRLWPWFLLNIMQSPPPKILLPRTTLAWITSLHENLSLPSSNSVLYNDQNKGGDLVITSQTHSKIPNHQKVFQKSTEYHEILPTSLTIIIQSKVTKPCLTYLM